MKTTIGTAALAACLLATLPVQRATAAAPAVLRCDGKTDNVTALNQGLAHGGIITLPPGVCMTSGTVFVRPGTTLLGAGQGVTTIRSMPNPTTDVVELLGKADISSLTVDGNASKVTLTTSAIHVLPVAVGSRVHDLEVMNSGSQGVRVQASSTQVTRVYSHGNWKTGIYVVGDWTTRTRTTGVSITGNTLRHNVLGLSLTGVPGDAIDIDRMTQNVTVQGNTLYDNDIILWDDGASPDKTGNTRSTGHVVTGNHVTNGQKNGVDVGGAVDAFTVSANTITNVIGYGITIHGNTRGGRVIGNTVNGATQAGIAVWPEPPPIPPPSGVSISGNTVAGVVAGRPAVMVTGGATNISVTGNTLTGAIATLGAGAGLMVQVGH